MSYLIINGKRPLFGTVKVSGSKNAALPVLFASLATRGISEIKGMPNIGDTRVALDILSSFGVKAELSGDILLLDTRNTYYKRPKCSDVAKIRASTYLLGSCLSRFGKCRLESFGGCNFCQRPVDLHIYAAKALGAYVDSDSLVAKRLVGGEIALPKPSVGASVNALIMASCADGRTHIKGFAEEPHVLLLIEYLRSCGAKIEIFDKEMVVSGGELHGGKVEIIGDMIEAGTYLTAGLVSGGEIFVKGVDVEYMTPFLKLITASGGEVILKNDEICIKSEGKLDYIRAVAAPYPDFPTDLQPIIAPLLAANLGGEITDTVFPERLGYLDVLSSFGLKFKREHKKAYIYPSGFKGASVDMPCLRGGAAALITALVSEGESRLGDLELLLRGYERPLEKLASLGANVRLG